MIFRDNGALIVLIEFIRGNGNQNHLLEKLEESWRKHTGRKCKFNSSIK